MREQIQAASMPTAIVAAVAMRQPGWCRGMPNLSSGAGTGQTAIPRQRWRRGTAETERSVTRVIIMRAGLSLSVSLSLTLT